MVSEPLLWPFLSSLVFISVAFFLTTLPPSQLPPQLLAVEPPTSSSRRPWVPDLQPPLLSSFTLHRPLLFASPLQVFLRLRFWRYHWVLPAPIYTLVEASPPSETVRAPTRRSKLLFCRSRATTRCSFFSRAYTCRHLPPTRRHAPPRAVTHLTCINRLADVITDVSPNSLLTSLLASSADVIFWIWIWTLTFQVERWLWLAVDRWLFWGWLFQSKFSLPSFSRRFHFCCLFFHIVSLNG